MEAVSEPREMTVKDAKETRVFKDVLVGEVWLGSGQSNMEFGTDFGMASQRSPRAAWQAHPQGRPVIRGFFEYDLAAVCLGEFGRDVESQADAFPMACVIHAEDLSFLPELEDGRRPCPGSPVFPLRVPPRHLRAVPARPGRFPCRA